MSLPIIRAAKDPRKLNERQFLTSWKEIAEYMRSGVRTVQRYEREFGLPVRRPTGKVRGAVMATRAEIDAWIAAGPIRETFRLARIERYSRIRSQTNKIEAGVIAMRKLKEQMQALRIETRSALNLLIDRVSAVRWLLPPASSDGYEPLVNMDMDKRLHVDGGKSSSKLNLAPSIRRSGGPQRYKTSLSTTQKPH